MKIALVQGRVRNDRPTDNLEHIKAALKGDQLGRAQLAVFPSLVLSGPLGSVSLDRPGLDIQYNKIFEDFLALSREFPGPALASSCWRFTGSGEPREEAFVVQNGRLLSGPAGAGGEAECRLKGLDLSLWPGRSTPPPEEADRVDLLITLKDRVYRGEPYFPPAFGPARAWRLNVSTVGGDGPWIFEGASWVFSPDGELKGWAHGFEGTMILFDAGSQNLPVLRPRPPRDPMDVLHQALVTGLRDYVRSVSDGQVVLGLSGGLDSALAAVLAADALGPENVLGVAMPSEFNAPESLTLARELAANLKMPFLTVPIDGLREAFTRSFLLTPKRDEKAGHLADENIQARIRGVLLMYLANREGRLLLATGNKSEAAMGYCTLYGDTCGALAPIGDLYKTRVYDLARHLNRNGERIPEGIIARPPSAELRADQKDEDSLPPYAVLDDILSLHLEGRRSGSRVAKEGGHSPMTVAWALSSLKKAAFKRSQMPFSLVASSHPLAGLDRRRPPVSDSGED